MKRQASEKTAASVARKFVDKALKGIFERQRNYKMKVLQDRELDPRSSSQIIFVNLSLLSQVKHRFTLMLEKVSGQWTVMTASFNSFTSSGSAIQGSIRRLEVSRPKVKQVKKTKAKAPAPTPKPTPTETKVSTAATVVNRQDGLVYAKVIRIGGNKELIVEHHTGKRMIFIGEDQPFYGAKTPLDPTHERMTPIHAGDTITYKPDRSFAGNHVFAGLPTKE